MSEEELQRLIAEVHSFLPPCDYQVYKGNVICDNPKAMRYGDPCSKRCEENVIDGPQEGSDE